MHDSLHGKNCPVEVLPRNRSVSVKKLLSLQLMEVVLGTIASIFLEGVSTSISGKHRGDLSNRKNDTFVHKPFVNTQLEPVATCYPKKDIIYV